VRISVLEGEALALLDAIRLVVSKWWENMIFELDSYSLLEAIRASTMVVP